MSFGALPYLILGRLLCVSSNRDHRSYDFLHAIPLREMEYSAAGQVRGLRQVSQP